MYVYVYYQVYIMLYHIRDVRAIRPPKNLSSLSNDACKREALHDALFFEISFKRCIYFRDALHDACRARENVVYIYACVYIYIYIYILVYIYNT